MSIKSPCIGVCSTTLGDDTCRGCGRTLEQIRDWGAYTNEQRSKIMKTLHWSKECQYISDITEVALRRRAPNPDQGLTMALFNYDLECLKRYLEMQRDSAHRDGRHDSVVYIQHCIDEILEA